MTVENARQSEGATFTEARVEARIPSAGFRAPGLRKSQRSWGREA